MEPIAEPEAAPVPQAQPTREAEEAVLETRQPAADDDYESEEVEELHGAPGWLKGVFLLLVSLLLGGMTFYAVATDLMGKLF